jgi:integrase
VGDHPGEERRELSMGVTVRQKVKGKGNPWWVFISHGGKRTSKMIGDKAAAQAVASKIRTDLQLGEFGFVREEKKPEPTFKDYADKWIKHTVPATCKQSTLRDYTDILRIHIIPSFGHLKIVDIKRGTVKDFLLSKLNQGYAPSTVSHMRDVISGVLNKAVDDEVITGNPAQRLKAICKKKRSKEIDPLSRSELKILEDTVREHFQDQYVLFLLLARTGVRIGEALAIQWGDIDFAGRFIDIKRSLVRGRISTPKNGKSRRVDMSLQLQEALQEHMIESRKKGFARGLGALPEYVFLNEAGNLIDKDNWRHRVFNKVLRKAGLRKIRIHDLRHTYATLRISHGHSVEDVSNQLGHHSPKLTWDVYYHWIPGKRKHEVDALDDALDHSLKTRTA